ESLGEPGRELADVRRRRLACVADAPRGNCREPLARRVHVLEPRFGLFELRKPEQLPRSVLIPLQVQRRPVVYSQDRIANGLWLDVLAGLAQHEKVAEALAHLLAVYLHEAVVHPITGELLARRTLTLSELVFVVREHQVEAAAVQIEAFAEVTHRHGRALDVPPRATGTVHTGPRGLAVATLLPQREIVRMALAAQLVLIDALARARLQIFELAVREFAVLLRGRHRKIDVPVDLVGVALVHQALDQRADLVEVLAHFGFDVRHQITELSHVVRVHAPKAIR